MKSRHSADWLEAALPRQHPHPRAAGAADDSRPTPGWKGHITRTAFLNPRTPSVPATLDLHLDEYYAAAALMGLLASQAEEPDRDWACEWSHDMGRRMALESRRRRRKGWTNATTSKQRRAR